MNTLQHGLSTAAELILQMTTNPLPLVPWLLSGLSLLCVYFLNNHRVMLGRYVGLLSALAWSVYGVAVDQWFFLVNHSVFALIYISAIIKFNSKRDEYKALNEEQQLEIETLKKEVERSRRNNDKAFKKRHQSLRTLAETVHKQARRNEVAALKMLDELDSISPNKKAT